MIAPYVVNPPAELFAHYVLFYTVTGVIGAVVLLVLWLVWRYINRII